MSVQWARDSGISTQRSVGLEGFARFICDA